MATVFLKPDREQRALGGHLWIFSGEVARVEGAAQDGGLVDVRAARGKWVGRGFLNRRSALAVRLLTHRPEPVDDAFFRRRLADAWAYRRRMVPATDAYRVVNGEGDLLPGLIVDRYRDVLVLQTLALGMEVRKDLLAGFLADLAEPAAIYERNDPHVRTLEGLPQRAGWLSGSRDPLVEIQEGPARFLVDVAAGQKTGFFLDQRENRLAAAAFLKDGEVFDAFCYTGAFAIYAALGGATAVTAVDSSADALALARRNAELNGVAERCSFVEENVFDELRRRADGGARFDAVILDPPPFARSKDALARAIAGYKEINLRAMRLLEPGGVLFTCSCSYHVHRADFLEMLEAASRDSGRRLELMRVTGASGDHPEILNIPETGYLKGALIQAVD